MYRTHVTCRHCGFGVPADAPVCPGCRRPAIDDWRRRARSIAKDARQTPKARTPKARTPRAQTPLVDDGYRSLLSLATAARTAMTITSVVAVATAITYVGWTFRVDDPTVTIDTASVELDRIAHGVTIGLLGLLAITGLAFIAWAVRAYANLPALGIRERRYWTIWLVVGWILPGANLLVPKLLVDDIWRASSPQNPIDGGGDAWQRRPVASVVNRWWGSFLVTPAIVVLAVVTARGGLADFDQQVAVGALGAVAAISIVVAAAAARELIAVITVAQARRADVILDLRESQRSATEDLLATELGRR